MLSEICSVSIPAALYSTLCLRVQQTLERGSQANILPITDRSLVQVILVMPQGVCGIYDLRKDIICYPNYQEIIIWHLKHLAIEPVFLHLDCISLVLF